MNSRILYFDPFNGVAGNMILGALVDLGLPIDHLRRELDKLELGGFQLMAKRVKRLGIQGTWVQVRAGEGTEVVVQDRHDHSHPRGFQHIRQLIEQSSLDAWVKEKSVGIFERLGQAEAKVHQVSLEKIHFHEVGALDAIIDIVGACVGFRFFDIDCFFTAPLNLGGGTVSFSHGSWPVPAPATAELIKGFPSFLGRIEGELTTPTGAAVVTTLSKEGLPPLCRYEKWGFGAGDKEISGIPNVLRLALCASLEMGDMAEEVRTSTQQAPAQGEDIVVLLEASIDDMDAETLGHFLELALRKGALDIYYTPLHMKKSRPGLLLSLLCRDQDRERMAELVFQETTTLGIRWSPWRRWVLERDVKEVETEYGLIRVKIGRFRGRIINVAPEYEDLRLVAERVNLPLKVLRQKVMEKIPHNYD